MERRSFLKNMGLFSALAGVSFKGLASTSNGITNLAVKGKIWDSGKGIKGVIVSDGFSVVVTDNDGAYSIFAHDKAQYVFVSMPAGYEFANEKGLPRFYKLLDKSKQTQTVDFSLDKLKIDDDKHAFVIWADTQIWDAADAEQLKTISAPDTKQAIAALGNIPVHGICVGDLVWDKFELFPDYTKAIEETGVPFFQVIGNHDMDVKTARTDEYSQDKFKSLFGPTYYSFNRGKIHYVVLDDVFFIGVKKKYIGYITEEQLQWLEKDLKYVPKGSTVVVSLHIPTNSGDAKRNKKEEELGGVVNNRKHLYDLLQDYKVHIMSGHTHWNENWESKNIMEHNHGTVCGAWWTGPVCTDGTPSGYAVYTVNGNNVSWQYKATGKPISKQMTLYIKGAIPEKPNAIIANVWNYDNKWKVEWIEDGQNKGNMQAYLGYDPIAFDLYKGPDIPAKHKGTEPVLTEHLFIAEPSVNAKEIIVKVTDRFGRIYEDILKLG